HVRVETIRGGERDLPAWVGRLAQGPGLIHADPIAAAALLRNIDAVGGRALNDGLEEGEERASAERHGARRIESSQLRIVDVHRSATQDARIRTEARNPNLSVGRNSQRVRAAIAARALDAPGKENAPYGHRRVTEIDDRDFVGSAGRVEGLSVGG